MFDGVGRVCWASSRMFSGRGRLDDVPGVKTDARGGIPAHVGGRGDRVSSRIHDAVFQVGCTRRPCFKSDSRGGGDAVFQVGFTRRPAKENKKLKKRERNLHVLCLIAPCRTEFE